MEATLEEVELLDLRERARSESVGVVSRRRSEGRKEVETEGSERRMNLQVMFIR